MSEYIEKIRILSACFGVKLILNCYDNLNYNPTGG